ncbi:hypothetical protein AX16_010898 [Volvariella volvacea WC 439]|nr:hypothetical protein AX16_010898 [Volvariella volvacea WC 439]
MKEEAIAINKTIYNLLNKLKRFYKDGVAKSWQKVWSDIKELICCELAHKHKVYSYCEDHQKAEATMSDVYYNWARPAEAKTSTKREPTEAPDGEKTTKQVHVKFEDIINVDDDSDPLDPTPDLLKANQPSFSSSENPPIAQQPKSKPKSSQAPAVATLSTSSVFAVFITWGIANTPLAFLMKSLTIRSPFPHPSHQQAAQKSLLLTNPQIRLRKSRTLLISHPRDLLRSNERRKTPRERSAHLTTTTGSWEKMGRRFGRQRQPNFVRARKGQLSQAKTQRSPREVAHRWIALEEAG